MYDMTLGQKQRIFTKLVGKLIAHAYELGYELTFGETWRAPDRAGYLEAAGLGISNSLHLDRLAIDLNLFKDGRYLRATKAHEPLGVWWENQSTTINGTRIECCWGGRFTRRDGNHYSIAHGGRK